MHQATMALPSRLGAFMVGTAIGATQCFYWLHEDVQTVQTALSRKIASIQEQVEEKERKAALRLAAIQDAVPSLKSSDDGHLMTETNIEPAS